MSLGTPTDTNSTLESDDLSEISFLLLDDEPYETVTPLPTIDSVEVEDPHPNYEDSTLLMMSPPPSLERQTRPETSVSSIFSFVDDDRKSLASSCLRLPTFHVPENWDFLNLSASSEAALNSRCSLWMDGCIPSSGSFELECMLEQLRNPRQTRSEPEIPSLFKKREHGCGYCKSVGYPRWETHTRKKCVRLFSLGPCKICGAHGEMNHTETYCPEKPSVILPFASSFLQYSDERRAQRSITFFNKYSSTLNLIFPQTDFFF